MKAMTRIQWNRASDIECDVAAIADSASDWLAPILNASPEPLRPLSGVPGRYGYFQTTRTFRVIAIEAPGGLELPIGITAAPAVVSQVLRSTQVSIGNSGLEFDGKRLSVTRYRGECPQFSVDSGEAANAASNLERALEASGRTDEPLFVEHAMRAFAHSLESWPDTDFTQVLSRLIGLGLGSTPSGDDVVAGATATLAAFGRGHGPVVERIRPLVASLSHALCATVESTTPLSAELLACSARGYMLPQLTRCITLAIGGQCDHTAISRLRLVGHNSGYFLAMGAVMALRTVATLLHRENCKC